MLFPNEFSFVNEIFSSPSGSPIFPFPMKLTLFPVYEFIGSLLDINTVLLIPFPYRFSADIKFAFLLNFMSIYPFDFSSSSPSTGFI